MTTKISNLQPPATKKELEQASVGLDHVTSAIQMLSLDEVLIATGSTTEDIEKINAKFRRFNPRRKELE